LAPEKQRSYQEQGVGARESKRKNSGNTEKMKSMEKESAGVRGNHKKTKENPV
jgi:hypothetical protein